jgi:hypothetical protein
MRAGAILPFFWLDIALTGAPHMKEMRLEAIYQQSEKGTLPLASYSFAHRQVKLSPDQVRAI